MKTLRLFIASTLIVVLTSIATMAREPERYSISQMRSSQIATVDGDLNEDGISDLVIAAQPNDSTRVLGIYFRGVRGIYDCFGLYENLLPAPDDPEYAEEEVSLKINKRGALVVSIHRFYSAGSWGVYDDSDIFRFRGDNFYRIGSERECFMRNTGEIVRDSRNYLTGRQMKVTSNEFDRDVPRRETWSDLPAEPLRPIGDCRLGED